MSIWAVAHVGGRALLPDYRMGELARISGVTARNIRAYRERGLLDPPRRAGRAAVYDDHHLAQLQAINHLLRRGFTSAHIAEFFDGVRSGTDLAGFLGLRPHAFLADVDGRDAEALLAAGLVRRADTGLEWANPAIGAIVARAGDQHGYVRFMLQLIGAIDGDVRRVAEEVSSIVQDVADTAADHRALSRLVAFDRLERALGQAP
jgi:DNA-binding transcriptional MerR regulator